MADMMAIVAKAVFEKEAGKAPALGTRLGMDRYVSANKNLEPLAKGGRLYLVTVRPPDEALWLVAILDQPKHDGTAWIAAACTTPITDISDLRSQIKFESGVGITSKKGSLGMSLQTPRALTAADTALLDAAAGAAPSAPAAAAAPAAAPDPTAQLAASLLQTILDDPDNDDARRIYADLRIQRGDPRGELILLELALAGRLSIRKRAQLAPRRAELLAAHGATWFPYKLSGFRTRHGFIESVEGSFAQIKAAAPKLFAAEPVTEVELHGVEEEDFIEPLLAAKWLPRIRHLILRGNLGDEAFGELCASPATANLRALNVTANELTGEALGALGTGLPHCKSLVLTGNELGEDGLDGLRAWRHLAGVESLYLSRCGLDAAAITSLLAAPLPRLEKLCLAENEDIGDDAAAAIATAAASARLPRLRYVDLSATGLGDGGLAQLAAARLPAMRRIDVRRNYLPRSEDPRVRV